MADILRILAPVSYANTAKSAANERLQRCGKQLDREVEKRCKEKVMQAHQVQDGARLSVLEMPRKCFRRESPKRTVSNSAPAHPPQCGILLALHWPVKRIRSAE